MATRHAHRRPLRWPTILALASAVSLTVSLAAITTGQAPSARGSGAISGTVVDAATGDSVPGALVELARVPAGQPLAATRQIADDRGRFAFVNLPAGDYTLASTKSGYLDGGFGREQATTDPLRPVPVAQAAWVSNLRVPLWRPAALSGIVRDESGQPVVGVYVRALAVVGLLGRTELAASQMTLTDDRGGFRLPNLSPGTYLVQVPSVAATVPVGTALNQNAPALADGGVEVDDATVYVIGRYPLPPPPVDGRTMGYPAAFHPASTSVVDAVPIDLRGGEDRMSVDVTLTPQRAVRVSGLVDGPAEALRNLTLRLIPAGLEHLGQGAEVATAYVGPDGRFTFTGVPAGTYTIDAPLRIGEFQLMPPGVRAYFPPPAGRRGWNRATEAIDLVPGLSFVSTDFRAGAGANHSGRTTVTVGTTDTTGVVVRLRPNGSMSGRLVLESDPDPARAGAPAPRAISVMLDPAAGETHLGLPRTRQPNTPDDGGAFEIADLGPGRYRLRVMVTSSTTFSDTTAVAASRRQLDAPEWLVKSVQWRGRDYVDEPFDAAATTTFTDVVVTITNAVPELTGRVRPHASVAPEAAMVIAFPTDAARWRDTGLRPDRMKAVPVSTEGAYRFANLPAGEYFVVAIDRQRAGTWRDPGFLARVRASASRVTLSWGARGTRDVDVMDVR